MPQIYPEPHLAVDGANSAGVGKTRSTPTWCAPGRAKAAPHEERAAKKFLFDDRATIRRFDASVSDSGEVIFLFPVSIDGLLSPCLGSAELEDARQSTDRDLR